MHVDFHVFDFRDVLVILPSDTENESSEPRSFGTHLTDLKKLTFARPANLEILDPLVHTTGSCLLRATDSLFMSWLSPKQ